MTKPRALVIAATIALTAAAGCKVGPDYQPPKENVPAAFAAAPQNAPPADIERWWESFHDATLSRLISQAVQANLDVRLAEARVREARAQLQGDRATLYPTLDADASYVHTRLICEPARIILPAFLIPGPTTRTSASSTPPGNWTSSAARAAPLNPPRTRSNPRSRRGATPSSRSSPKSLSTTSPCAANSRSSPSSSATSPRSRTPWTLPGRSSRPAWPPTLDVAQAEAQVEASRAQIPTLRTGAEQAIHRLSVLLDLPPAALEPELAPPGPLPAGPPAIPPGLPSDLLRRRPDIRQAERLVAAATANIGVATADLFPKFSLTGADGLESAYLGTFARRDSNFWSVGPSVTWRIFDAGQIRAASAAFAAVAALITALGRWMASWMLCSLRSGACRATVR